MTKHFKLVNHIQLVLSKISYFHPKLGTDFANIWEKNRLLNNDMSSTCSRHQGRSEERQVILQGCTAFLCQSQPPSTPIQLCLVWVGGAAQIPMYFESFKPQDPSTCVWPLRDVGIHLSRKMGGRTWWIQEALTSVLNHPVESLHLWEVLSCFGTFWDIQDASCPLFRVELTGFIMAVQHTHLVPQTSWLDKALSRDNSEGSEGTVKVISG